MRKWSFKYITRYLGKGKNSLLNRLQVKNDDGEVIKCIYNWNKIDEELMNYNKNYYKKAHDSIACKDTICNKLTCNKT